MGEGNDIYKEMDRIKKRVSELIEKTGTGFYGEKDVKRESNLTQKERQELNQLYERLKELGVQDDTDIRVG